MTTRQQKAKFVQKTVKLPSMLDRQLSAASRKTGLNSSDLIRLGVKRVLAEVEKTGGVIAGEVAE